MNYVHMPVLLEECIGYLRPTKNDSLMIDATQGEGGHSYAFLSRFPTIQLIGIDADVRIQEVAKERLKCFGNRVEFYSGWSQDFFAHYSRPSPPDRILFDLGVSVFHYEKSGRGFSFRKDEALDMRLDPSIGESAQDIVMNYGEKALADLFYQNADEKYSRRIARAIVQERLNHRIASSKDLARIVHAAVPAAYRHGPIHPATKTFQALRIAVNGELERLQELLNAALDVLAVDGVMGVISFHSIEDRLIKKVFRDRSKSCICPPNMPICTCGGKSELLLLTKKAVLPSSAEVQENSPSRSAQLRVVKKIFSRGRQQ